jgi:uroporphyrinogen decarboxylase
MTSKERVLAALEFKSPDRIPKDIWILPAARMKYGEDLEDICNRFEVDIASMVGPFDHGFTPEYYQVGQYMDPWGSLWTNLQAGVIGEVKNPVFKTYDEVDTYEPPISQFLMEWEENKENIAKKIQEARDKDKFVIGGWISLFERMQFLRGTENLYCDIALEEE